MKQKKLKVMASVFLNLFLATLFFTSCEKIREREFSKLLKIEDNYEKIVVSTDEFAKNYKGIKHLHIRQFLVDKK